MQNQSRLEEYVRLNGKYLKEAEALLGEREYAQASKKLWAAAAEMIKAVAAKRGQQLGMHKSLARFAEELGREHPEWGLPAGFDAAEALHINFFEDYLPEETVLRRANTVRAFVGMLRKLL